VAIEPYEEDWSQLRYVIVQGEAEILESGPEYGRGVTLLRAKYPQYERAFPLDPDRGVMIKVLPQSVLTWSLAGSEGTSR